MTEQRPCTDATFDSSVKSSEINDMPDWQKQELDRRQLSHEANPESVFTWEEANRRIRRSSESPSS
jgi:putative addiction module component (TIGR02574 family)